MIFRWFAPTSQQLSIPCLYGAIVAQARSVTFYADYRVPDTVEGRFDLIVLHLVLLLNRLGRSAEAVLMQGGRIGRLLGRLTARVGAQARPGFLPRATRQEGL